MKHSVEVLSTDVVTTVLLTTLAFHNEWTLRGVQAAVLYSITTEDKKRVVIDNLREGQDKQLMGRCGSEYRLPVESSGFSETF